MMIHTSNNYEVTGPHQDCIELCCSTPFAYLTRDDVEDLLAMFPAEEPEGDTKEGASA